MKFKSLCGLFFVRHIFLLRNIDLVACSPPVVFFTICAIRVVLRSIFDVGEDEITSSRAIFLGFCDVCDCLLLLTSESLDDDVLFVESDEDV